MSRPVYAPNFSSEKVTDALLEALPLVTRLIQSPCTLEELAASFPQLTRSDLERLLKRLVRSGLVTNNGQSYRAAERVIYSQRQGPQIDHLSKLFIPALMSLALDDMQDGVLLPLHLELSPEEQEKFYQDEVLPLFAELSAVADEAGDEGPDKFLFAAGTPYFSRDSEGLEQALEILRQAGNDRLDPLRKARSILTYFQGRMPSSTKATQAIFRFEKGLEAMKASPGESSYVLLLGFGSVPSVGVTL